MGDDAIAMYDGGDTVVLYEELAFQDVLPILWRPMTNPVDRELMGSFDERNLRLLQAWDAMEEHVPVEKQKSEDAPYAAEIVRLDLKINLLLDLVGQLLAANQHRPPSAPVRFNALGAMWRATGTLPEAGEQGIAEIYLRDCMAEPLRLAGRVTNVTPDGHIKVKFLPMGEAVSDLIEKLAFRRHRRQIAGARQPRRGQ
jgi:Atypical PilZ domain, cyclic di-GMP receptor